jgi:hypothetical protein
MAKEGNQNFGLPVVIKIYRSSKDIIDFEKRRGNILF